MKTRVTIVRFVPEAGWGMPLVGEVTLKIGKRTWRTFDTVLFEHGLAAPTDLWWLGDRINIAAREYCRQHGLHDDDISDDFDD